MRKKRKKVLQFMKSLNIRYIHTTDHPYYSVFVNGEPCGRPIRFFRKQYKIVYSPKLDALCDLIFEGLETCAKMCNRFENRFARKEDVAKALRIF